MMVVSVKWLLKLNLPSMHIEESSAFRNSEAFFGTYLY